MTNKADNIFPFPKKDRMKYIVDNIISKGTKKEIFEAYIVFITFGTIAKTFMVATPPDFHKSMDEAHQRLALHIDEHYFIGGLFNNHVINAPFNEKWDYLINKFSN